MGSGHSHEHGHSHGWTSNHAVTHAYGAHGLLGARTMENGQVLLEMMFDTQILAGFKTVPALVSIQGGGDAPVQITLEQQAPDAKGLLRFLGSLPAGMQATDTLLVVVAPTIDGEEKRCSWVEFVPSRHQV